MNIQTNLTGAMEMVGAEALEGRNSRRGAKKWQMLMVARLTGPQDLSTHLPTACQESQVRRQKRVGKSCDGTGWTD